MTGTEPSSSSIGCTKLNERASAHWHLDTCSIIHHCSCALVTIDLTAAVLEEAAECNADLIIAYHPPIFSGIKRFTAAPLVQRAAAAGCVVLV